MYTSEVAAEAAAFVVAPVPYRRERNLIGEIDSFFCLPCGQWSFCGVLPFFVVEPKVDYDVAASFEKELGWCTDILEGFNVPHPCVVLVGV